MLVNGHPQHTIWLSPEGDYVGIIDQRFLPYKFQIEELRTAEQMIRAIQEMHLRGAIVIGVAAAFGVYLAAREAAHASDFEEALKEKTDKLRSARPTAVNLAWGVERILATMQAESTPAAKIEAAKITALQIADDEIKRSLAIGEHGFKIIAEISRNKAGRPVNILTHCNAGWLACVDWGTATAPIYLAQARGLPLHIWVDETRPRNQGARLTAWELAKQGVPHTVIADNTGGHLMQHGLIDMVIVGADRVTRTGDVANKIGTYLKALAAWDNQVPFYVAFPSSTIDWRLSDGVSQIPIEERDAEEIRYVEGNLQGRIVSVEIPSRQSPCANYAFDVTPARLITGLITERGICRPSEASLLELYPEKAAHG